MSDLNIGGALGEGIDIGGVREDVNKITEEDRKRIQDNNQKAKQVGQQIKKDKKINNEIANFLGHLLKVIENQKIIVGIYNVFFKVKNPKTNITYLRKNPNNVVIVGIFAPFYPEEIKQYNLMSFFEKIYNFGGGFVLVDYIEYIKKLSNEYHDNIPINKEDFLDFLVEIIDEFGVNENDKEFEIKKEIENMLYTS